MGNPKTTYFRNSNHGIQRMNENLSPMSICQWTTQRESERVSKHDRCLVFGRSLRTQRQECIGTIPGYYYLSLCRSRNRRIRVWHCDSPNHGDGKNYPWYCEGDWSLSMFFARFNALWVSEWVRKNIANMARGLDIRCKWEILVHPY